MNVIGGRIWAALSVALLVQGCRTPPAPELRRDHAARWTAQLQDETARLLPPGAPPLGLPDCVQLARERTLALTQARLSERLTQLYQDASFSVFLPQVSLEYADTRLSEPPEHRVGGGAMVMSDQNLRQATVKMMYPVFAPNAWLMYFSARRGVAIQKLVRERSEEMLDLQVAGRFFQVAAAEEARRVQEAAVAAAEALDHEVGALAASGYALEADRARVAARRLDALRQRDLADRDLALARGRLLESLNLWPLADLRIDPASLVRTAGAPWTLPGVGKDASSRSLTAAEAAGLPLEDWLGTALVNRKELWAADQAVVLSSNEVTRALTLFLPSLAGFANLYDTSDSFTVNQTYWGTGFAGTMALFTGFRNVQEYRMARARRQAVFEDREARALNILLQVSEARQNWLDAGRQCEVARAAAEAAALDYNAAQKGREEGRESLATELQRQTAHFAAQSALRLAEYQQALAQLVFRHAVGLSWMENPNKDAHQP